MIINDKSGLLKPEEVDNAFDTLLEELDQTAAGPELEAGAELKDEATEKKEPESAVPSMDNKDVYSNEVHDQKEEVEGVVVKESDQLAAGPELEKANELKDEATVEKKPEVAEPETDNKDVYSDEVHDQKEDVEGVVVKEDTVKEEEVEPSPEAEKAEEVFGSDDKDESELEADDTEVGSAEDTVSEVDSLTEEEDKSEEKDEESDELEKEDEEDKKDESEEKEDSDEEKEKEPVDEAMNSLFALLKTINEETSQLANGPELEKAGELKDEATEKGAGEPAVKEVKNTDLYSLDCHDQKEDVEGVVVKESDQLAAGPELEAGAELKDEATEKKEPESAVPEVDNKDVYCDHCHEQKEDVEGVVVKESSQLANGPELEKAGELKDEATEKGAGEPAVKELKNSDIYTADVHKQVEDVVGVIVEAAARCRANGKKATMTNITEAVMSMFEAQEADPKALMGIGKEFADKEYDVDAAVESKEMNGGAEEKYEDLQGEGANAALSAEVPAEAVHESVKYTSLKEACMLDEGYFAQDSYTKETADAKAKKLTEQISLLMAREAGDPLYDELLKESIYCQRLQEQCFNKYAAQASAKANIIIKKKLKLK